MSDTSPAIPESIDPANQHKALTAGQQAVIKKLFRRLIIFLFVLFIFSFLDRINIGFAGLTMGRDLGLSATMFGLATTLFYAAYVIFGIPSNIMLSIVGARRWIATIMVLWGIASTATMFATGPTSLYVLRILVGITEAGFLPGILLYLTFWFPAYFRARANALFMVAMTRARKNLYISHYGYPNDYLDAFKSNCSHIDISTSVASQSTTNNNNNNPWGF